MTLLSWVLVALSQMALVAGQIYLKRAMTRRELPADTGRQRGWVALLGLGIALMTVWFLLWLGVMHRIDLSQLMPLEGLSPLLIVLGAGIFLGEKLNWMGWTGVILTCVGVLLVSAS